MSELNEWTGLFLPVCLNTNPDFSGENSATISVLRDLSAITLHTYIFVCAWLTSVFSYTKDASENGIKEVKTGNKVITEVFSQFSVEHFIKPIMAVSLCENPFAPALFY